MQREILIAEDHAFTAGGIQAALSGEGWTVLPPVANGLDAIAMAKRHHPAVAILDYGLPEASGLEVFLELQRWAPDTRCVIVTANETPTVLQKIAASGVHGLFPKSVDPVTFKAAIAQIIEGAVIVHPASQAIIDQAAPGADLTARELQVLHALAQGLTTSAIAQELSISPKTVESHRASLTRKLDVSSTPSLLVSAMRMGLVE